MTAELQAAIAEIERTIRSLRNDSQEGWAAQLERLLADVRSADRFACKEALYAVGQFCHGKALGDADVAEPQLDAMHSACARAFNQLEARS